MAGNVFEMKLLVMLAETPVHAGSGAELGAVDLPVQRERHTRYPTIHGSGVKGVLRDLSEQTNGKQGVTKLLFGSEPPQGAGGEALEAGSLVVSDARLLLLPVRSVGEPFAWTTCPYLLERLKRDLQQTGAEPAKELVAALNKAVEGMGAEKARVSAKFPLEKALIEELEVEVETGAADDLARVLGEQFLPGDPLKYWRELLPKNLVVLPDALFADLALHCTEIVTRVRLTDKKTVAERALWTEEYVPADTLFYSVLGLETRRLAAASKDKSEPTAMPNGGGWVWVRDLVTNNPLAQFGGKETIGRGFFRLQLWPS